MSAITGQQGIGGFLMAGLNGISQLYGAVAGGGLQYMYNRINGPSGNQNSMLNLSGALGPNAGMMGMPISDLIKGLSQSMPVMGTQKDMIDTALAGQSVGALMKGTNGRNGFFESVRQMQILTPGAAPGAMSGALAGYIGNTKSQQMGAYLGEGAFTMIGKGGRYKSLAEWAAGITKFMQEHRMGGQSAEFTKSELMAQNFPGSNINAWFQMMGVPSTMIDYWWQYALTAAKDDEKGLAAIAPTTGALSERVSQTRGLDLTYERLRNVTQGTRRDYLMGNKMYGMYNARESADRRFNVAMQGTDTAIAQMMSSSNVGALMSLLPTPVMEMLMPVISSLVSSPLGGIAALAGGALGSGGSSPAQTISNNIQANLDVMPAGLAAKVTSGIFGFGSKKKTTGDVPIGDAGSYGDAGGTDTSHLSPGLASRVKNMLKANPNLQISSGYRDTVTQNRLQRNGVGRVGPASTSAHTRGWAVDIGPKSQGGWLAANAGKFGLQSAYNKGEPWHIQMANTMTVGDVPLGPNSPIGDGLFGTGIGPSFGPNLNPVDALKGIAGDIAKAIFSAIQELMKTALSPITDSLAGVVKNFIGSGNLSKMVDTATSMYGKVITAPVSGIIDLFGKSGLSGNDITSLVNQKANVGLSLSAFEGFQSSNSDTSGGHIFNVGDPIMNMASETPTTLNANVGSPIIFNATINVNGMGSTGVDARKMAATLVDHMQEEISKKKWLVS
jgi:hypothetical protein